MRIRTNIHVTCTCLFNDKYTLIIYIYDAANVHSQPCPGDGRWKSLESVLRRSILINCLSGDSNNLTNFHLLCDSIHLAFRQLPPREGCRFAANYCFIWRSYILLSSGDLIELANSFSSPWGGKIIWFSVDQAKWLSPNHATFSSQFHLLFQFTPEEPHLNHANVPLE